MRGSAGRAALTPGPGAAADGGGAGAGGACAEPGVRAEGERGWLMRGNPGPRGPPPAPPPSKLRGLRGAPASAAVAVGCVEIEAGTSEPLVSGGFPGSEARRAGRGALPPRGAVAFGASPTGQRSPRSPGVPETEQPEAPADGPSEPRARRLRADGRSALAG